MTPTRSRTAPTGRSLPSLPTAPSLLSPISVGQQPTTVQLPPPPPPAGFGTPPPLLLTNRDLDQHKPRQPSPHQHLQQFLNQTPHHTWGIAANQHQIRLLRNYHHTTSQGAILIEIANLLQTDSFPQLRAIHRLLHPSRFYQTKPTTTPGKPNTPTTPLENFYHQALHQGITIGKALQHQAQHALTALLNGISNHNQNNHLKQQLQTNPKLHHQLFSELLTYLYRIIFLLYAEQRNLLQNTTPTYANTYSITHLTQQAQNPTPPEPHHTNLWEGLKTTFTLFSNQQLSQQLGNFPYNGQLFDPQNTPHLNQTTIENQHLLTAITALTTIQQQNHTQKIDYRYLGVEEIGSVYETLLSATLHTTPTGHIQLSDTSLQRTTLGAHYTPPQLVQLTLNTVIDDLITQTLKNIPTTDKTAQENAILNLNIIDPACGSAHFLIGAIDQLTHHLTQIRHPHTLPTNQLTNQARQDILRNCIHGVDKDPHAVELAKTALWIHCAVDNQPLTFLDHKIICGDSLIGWPMFGIPNHIDSQNYNPPKNATTQTRQKYHQAKQQNQQHLDQYTTNTPNGLPLQTPTTPTIKNLNYPPQLNQPAHTPTQIHHQQTSWQQYQQTPEYQHLQQTANLWTAAHFWNNNTNLEIPTTKHYHQQYNHQLPNAHQYQQHTQPTITQINPLHWPLTYHHIQQQGGFDLIIGNPPWENYFIDTIDYFRQIGRLGISEEPLPHRRQELIEALQHGDEDDQQVYQDWKNQQRLFAQSNEFARNSGRYTRVKGRPNTYLMFTELAYQLVKDGGFVALVIKSSLGIEQVPNPVWRYLLADRAVKSYFDIVNMGTFPDVVDVERFAVLAIQKNGNFSHISSKMVCMGLREAIERDPYIVEYDQLEVFNPITNTLISIAHKDQYELAYQLQSQFHYLDLDGEIASIDSKQQAKKKRISNPWSIGYRSPILVYPRMFQRKSDLIKQGFVLGKDKVFRHPDGRTALPLMEGQMINSYDHRHKTYEGYTGNPYRKMPRLRPVPDELKEDPDFEIEPRYWVLESDISEKLEVVRKAGEGFVGIRDVGRPYGDQRSARGALIPYYPTTGKLPVLRLPYEDVGKFLAVWNSTVFDFLARSHQPGPNLSFKWILSQVAVPLPTEIDPEVAQVAMELSVTSNALANNYQANCHPYGADTRLARMVWIDAQIAKKAYQINNLADYEIVLDSFEKLALRQYKKYGCYRFKCLCIGAFKEIETGNDSINLNLDCEHSQ